MSAADNLYAELTRGVSHDQVRQHLIDDHRAEVLAEAAATPLIVRRVDCSVEPDRDSGETEMVVCCVAEDGRPVALLLDDETRAKLAGLLGGRAPGLDERALQLADHIINTGGVWTTGKAHRWVTEAISPKPPIHFTRHSLQALAVHGYLTERHEPGRVSYTPKYVKDGGR